MKAVLVYILFFFFSNQAVSSQTRSSTINTIDSFFAGIPLQKTFEDWIQYVNDNPVLGIDSLNARGIYSSIKSGNKFPFPDDVPVKILLNKDTRMLLAPSQDTIWSVYIEGVFGKSNQSRKNALNYFDILVKMLKPYYRARSNYGYFVEFSRGINENFPDIILETAYFDELQFYYITIVFEYSWMIHHKIPK